MIVPRVFKSRQRKRKNISIILSSHQEAIKKIWPVKTPILSGFSSFPVFALESRKCFFDKRKRLPTLLCAGSRSWIFRYLS